MPAISPTEAFFALHAMFDRMTIADLIAFTQRIAKIQGIPLNDGRAILAFCRDTFVNFDGLTQEVIALGAIDLSPGFIPVPVEDLLNADLKH
jgi:hypothetical protein